MPEYTVGERLRSRVSTVEVVVVRAPAIELDITCDGAPLAREGEELGEQISAGSPDVAATLGKRYEDQTSGIELLCVVPGLGQLAADDRPLTLLAPKPLPSSD